MTPARIFLAVVATLFVLTTVWFVAHDDAGAPSLRVAAVQPTARPAYDRRIAPATTSTTTTTTTVAPSPPPAPRARSAPRATSSPGGDPWSCIRFYESRGNYADPNGGAYQFLDPTWRSMGTGYPTAESAPPAVQDDAARRLQARSGWGQWTTARRCGLR